jgi:hypothetical protein
MSCMSKATASVRTGQCLVDQRPVFDKRTVFSKKAGVYRPTKRTKKRKFL